MSQAVHSHTQYVSKPFHFHPSHPCTCACAAPPQRFTAPRPGHWFVTPVHIYIRHGHTELVAVQTPIVDIVHEACEESRVCYVVERNQGCVVGW